MKKLDRETEKCLEHPSSVHATIVAPGLGADVTTAITWPALQWKQEAPAQHQQLLPECPPETHVETFITSSPKCWVA